MKYQKLLVICGQDWQEKINLAIFDREPTENEIREVLRNYWYKYERGNYEEFESFIGYLKESSRNDLSPWRKGVWIEDVAFFSGEIVIPDLSATETREKAQRQDAS